MHLALIADIHGNLPALDAVLAELDREGVDRIVCLGDISIGPQPVEALERIRALGCPVILGNWDAWLVDGVELLGFEGSARSFEDAIVATTPDAELEEMLDGRTALVHAGGHTHFQLVRRFGESLLVNPGSIGLPFRQALPGIMEVAPWAEYGLLRHEEGRLSIELRRTPFDLEAFLTAMRESGMPHADWWAARWTSQSQTVS